MNFSFYIYSNADGRFFWQRMNRAQTFCNNGGLGFASETEAHNSALECAARERT